MKFTKLTPGFWSIVLAASATAAHAAAPAFSGNTDIARRIKSGDARVMLLGDSLQNLTQREYLRRWPIKNVSGQFVSENVGYEAGAYTFSSFNYPWLSQKTPVMPDNAAALTGLPGFSPGAAFQIKFAAKPVGPEDNLASNRIYEMDIAADQEKAFHAGAWANVAGKKMNVDLLVYANPNGLDSGLKFDVRGNSITTPLAGTAISTFAPIPQIRKYTLSFDAPAWEPGKALAASVRMQPGITPAQNSSAIILGARYYTEGDGFQMTNVAWGGKKIEYYVDPKNTTDENLDDFINYTGSDLALIWIGANNAGNLDKGGYKTKMEALIQRYKAARPEMQFALVSTYDLNVPVYSDYADALHEIAQKDSSVLFLNLYGTAGDFATLDAKYLSDHVHPSEEGAKYFADQVWGLIDNAAAVPMPEPGAVSMLAAGGVFLLRRRARRS